MDNAEMKSSGLKCDNPNCDWKDESIQIQDYENWLNAPCPKCGENVLTEEDYQNVQMLLFAIEIANSMSPEDLESLAGTSVDPNDPFWKDANGKELLNNLSKDEKVVVSFNTHKTVSATNIKKAD